MDSNDDGYIPVVRHSKHKHHGKVTTALGTPQRNPTGQLMLYTTKIRVILIKRHKNQELLIGATMKALLTDMIHLDNSITVESCHNKELSFNNITNYPRNENDFLQFFEIRELHKTNGQTSFTIFFNIKSTTQHTLNKMKTNRTFLQTLRTNGVFTFEHPFEGQTLERIGFFSELLHKSMHMNDFHKKVKLQLEQTIINNPDYQEVPPFAINTNVARHRTLYNGQPSFHKTEAFEVECEPKNAATLIKLLCLADLPLRQFGTFIPFSIIREDPELLIQKMEDNNKYRNIMTNMYLNGWHPSEMHDTIEGNTTVMQLLLQQKDLYIASIERNYNTDSAGQWILIIPITAQNDVKEYINNFLIPATTALKSYDKATNINENYKSGLSITRFIRPLAHCGNKLLTDLRRKTTFDDTQDNRSYHSEPTPAQQRNTHMGTINFSSSPNRKPTPATTNAWRNPAESHSVVSQTSAPNNPYIPQRRCDESVESTIQSNQTDATAVSLLITQFSSMETKITAMQTEIIKIGARQSRAENTNTPHGTNNNHITQDNRKMREDVDAMAILLAAMSTQLSTITQAIITGNTTHMGTNIPTDTTPSPQIAITIPQHIETNTTTILRPTETRAQTRKPPPNPQPYLSQIIQKLSQSPAKLCTNRTGQVNSTTNTQATLPATVHPPRNINPPPLPPPPIRTKRNTSTLKQNKEHLDTIIQSDKEEEHGTVDDNISEVSGTTPPRKKIDAKNTPPTTTTIHSSPSEESTTEDSGQEEAPRRSLFHDMDPDTTDPDTPIRHKADTDTETETDYCPDTPESIPESSGPCG